MKHLWEVWNKEILKKRNNNRESRNTKEKQMSQTKLVSEKMSYMFKADESGNHAILVLPSIHCCSLFIVVSDSLWPHTRLLCPSLSSGVCSISCPLSQWCHPTILSSVVHFSCLQSFPASGSFPVSQLFASGGQSIGPSASASVLPMNSQD